MRGGWVPGWRSARGVTLTLLAALLSIILGAASGASGRARATPASGPPRGALGLLTGPGGCLSRGPGCDPLRGPRGLNQIAVSPDGRNLYLTGQAGGLAVLARNRRSGRLHQLRGTAGCARSDGLDGCARVAGLAGLDRATVSPDGRSVYVTTRSGIFGFARDRLTGRLRPISGRGGCVDALRRSCQPLRGMDGPSELRFADASTLYVAGTDGGGAAAGSLAVMKRDPASGRLNQLAGPGGCLNDGGRQACGVAPCLNGIIVLALSRDGHFLYSGSTDSLNFELTSPGAVATFTRAPGTGALIFLGCVKRTEAISGLQPSPSGNSVYVGTLFGDRGTGVAGASVDLYAPDAQGVLQRRRQLACEGSTACRIPLDLGPASFALSIRAGILYAAYFFGGLAAVRIDHGRFSTLPGRSGCVVARDAYMPPRRCARAGSEAAGALATSPDGRNLYAAVLGNGSGSGSLYPGGVEAFTITG